MPMRCLSTWLAAAGIEDGPVFRPINRYERVLPRRLSAQSVALVIKRLAAQARVRSCCTLWAQPARGFVTNAVQRGASAASICAQTGHRSDEMMQRYVRAGRQFGDNANLKDLFSHAGSSDAMAPWRYSSTNCPFRSVKERLSGTLLIFGSEFKPRHCN